MSGGYFEYNQYRLEEISEDIIKLISNYENGEFEDDYYKEVLDDDIIEIFKKAVDYLNTTYKYIHEIDWFLSGDTDKETLLKNIKDEIN